MKIPHSVTLYSAASSTDTGGGTAISYTSAQSAVPCSINTASASTVEKFAQEQIEVTHTIGIYTSKLTAAPARGWKAVATDTGASYHIEGIAAGRAYGSIPAFTYLHCREML